MSEPKKTCKLCKHRSCYNWCSLFAYVINAARRKTGCDSWE